ncbi:alpha/beta hydrolase [Micromonospora arborensis]|uniref:alpha/beta fold hydrolase n=1 Tax=Micromonospora arborensis TaxID=2116518 RepID=UPI0033D2ED5F
MLAVGGARYSGAAVAETVRLAADDVTGMVVDDCGHYVAEEQPERFTRILADFLGGKPVAGVPHS